MSHVGGTRWRGEGRLVRRRLCKLARGVWEALQHPQWTVATFFVCLFYFFLLFLFDFYFWCLHIFTDQASQRQGALWACGRRLKRELEEGRGELGLVRLLDVAVVVPCGNVQHLKKVVFTNDISVGGKRGRGNFEGCVGRALPCVLASE